MRTTDKDVSSLSFNWNRFTVFGEGGPLIGGPFRRWCCHASVSSASLKNLVSLLSRSGTPHVKLCVALAEACKAPPKKANAIVDVTFGPGVLSWSTSSSLPVCRHAFLYLRGLALNSNVRCNAFFASTQITSWAARRLQTSLKALQSLTPMASCAAQQSENSLVAAARSSHEQSRLSCRRPWSFWVLSSSSATSKVAACNTSPASCSLVTFAMVASKSTYSFARASNAWKDFWLRSLAFSFTLVFFL